MKSVTINYSKEIKITTAMGATGTARKAGLADWKLTLRMYQDYASGKTDALLNAAVGVETAIKVRPSKTDAISATNPEYQGNGMMGEYSPVDGSVGDMDEVGAVFESSDGVALIRDVTP